MSLVLDWTLEKGFTVAEAVWISAEEWSGSWFLFGCSLDAASTRPASSSPRSIVKMF